MDSRFLRTRRPLLPEDPVLSQPWEAWEEHGQPTYSFLKTQSAPFSEDRLLCQLQEGVRRIARMEAGSAEDELKTMLNNYMEIMKANVQERERDFVSEKRKSSGMELELQMHRDILEEKDKEISKLISANHELNAKVTQLQQECNSCQSRLDSYLFKTSSLEKNLVGVQVELEQAVRENEILTEEIENLRNLIRSSTQESAVFEMKLEEEVIELRQKLSIVMKDCNQSEAHAQKLNKTASLLFQDWQKAEEKNMLLHNQVTRLKEVISKQSHDLTKLEEQRFMHKSVEMSAIALQEQARAYEAGFMDEKQRADFLDRQREESVRTLRVLSQQYGDLSANYDRLQTKCDDYQVFLRMLLPSLSHTMQELRSMQKDLEAYEAYNADAMIREMTSRSLPRAIVPQAASGIEKILSCLCHFICQWMRRTRLTVSCQNGGRGGQPGSRGRHGQFGSESASDRRLVRQTGGHMSGDVRSAQRSSSHHRPAS
eukprot:765260-Hanusia_phi.AAC.4